LKLDAGEINMYDEIMTENKKKKILDDWLGFNDFFSTIKLYIAH